MEQHHCLRCNHDWYPRSPNKPRRCAYCNVLNWDKPPRAPKEPKKASLRVKKLTEEEIESIKTKRQTFVPWGRTMGQELKDQVGRLAVEFDLTLRVDRMRKLGYAFIVTNEDEVNKHATH